jgi:hypothetical protein
VPQTAKDQLLPTEIAQSIGKTIYYYGKINDLSESQLLSLCDALAPYYPVSDEENAASLVLREWIEIQKVRQTAGQSLKELRDLAGSAVDAWTRLMDRRQYEEREWRERRFEERRYEERRYREERHSEMNTEMLYKELAYQFKSGDPRAMITAVDRLVEEAVRRNQSPVPVIPPPQVAVPPELVSTTQEFMAKTEEKLSAYTERVAKAKQSIARYIYRVVAAEKITPVKE